MKSAVEIHTVSLRDVLYQIYFCDQLKIISLGQNEYSIYKTVNSAA